MARLRVTLNRRRDKHELAADCIPDFGQGLLLLSGLILPGSNQFGLFWRVVAPNGSLPAGR